MEAADPLFVAFLLTSLMLFRSAQQQGHDGSCGVPFMCGKLGEIRYPFKNLWGPPPDECGLYTLDCSDWKNPKVQLKGGEHWYGVQQISQAGSITINDPTLQKRLKSRRCESLESFGLPRPDWFSNVSSPNIVSLFKCNRSSLHSITSPTSDFQYSTTCGDYNLYYSTPTKLLLDNSSFPDFPQDNCSFIQLPAASHTANLSDFFSFFTDNFFLEVIVLYGCVPCLNEKRQCLIDTTKKHSPHCAPKGIYLGTFIGPDQAGYDRIAKQRRGLEEVEVRTSRKQGIMEAEVRNRTRRFVCWITSFGGLLDEKVLIQ
ncbi:hypothetical protein FEM48_Zijuj10G0139400 [Ziziphus jujuba var. spinosa]|uniref:Wall-associated receptor kinase galacturonan-binding domain-containing protein n=1 Tax=Ziziphus jujuba var. spinosa TaxID=714518 RepID=A0A978UNS6_ZIZJJ|nr:hypothetical protein FEM48_Zijuj10G0139400 [Ziziphus jujuba var. spinosa]